MRYALSLGLVVGSFLVGFGASTCSSPMAAAEIEGLLQRVPQGANALVVINSAAILKTPMAEKNGWRKKRASAYAESPIHLPPDLKRMMLASQFDIRGGSAAWEVAVLQLTGDASLKTVARSESGILDTIHGQPALATPWGTIAVQLGQRELGIMYPANRQAVSRWVARAMSDRSSTLSPYLQHAASFVTDGPRILMGLDLTDVLSPAELKEKLETSPTVLSYGLDHDALVELVGSIRGVTLGISIGKEATGKLRVEFGKSTAMLGKAGKPLILEVLSNNDASIDEFADWKVTVSGNSISMQGKLTISGLRRVASLIELPSPDRATIDPNPEKVPGKTDAAYLKQVTLENSKRYFASIESMIRGLRRPKGNSTSSTGLWMEKYARRVERLPVLHVDKDLLDYSSEVSVRLREAADAYRMVAVYAKQQKVRGEKGYVPYTVRHPIGYSYTWGWTTSNSTGWRRYDTTPAARRQNSATWRREKAKAVERRLELMKEIEQMTVDMRRKLTERYKTEF